jgi:branched-chain amino acid aminotransferase
MISFANKNGVIWFNGSYKKWTESNIHVLNHGLHYASCVFEGLRVYEKKIFKLEEHIRRLFKSALILDLKIQYSIDEIISKTIELVDKEKITNGYIRPVVWRGSEKMAISAINASTNIAIAAWEWPSYFSPDLIEKGIKLTVSKWKRPSPESAPTNSKAAGLYMICSLSKHEAEKDGFDDALMLDYRNYIAEATGANIFFVKNKKLYSPKPDCFLNGITRQCVIKIAKEHKIQFKEDHFNLNFLEDCEEVFLTGTAVEITPVASIDHYKFGVGDTTKFLIENFKKLVIK